MTIKAIKTEDITDGLQRNDHIVFSLNTFGIHPAGAGYGFIQNQLVEDYCAELKDVGQNPIGTIITKEVPEYHLWLHGIVNHYPDKGWPYEDECVYCATQSALNELQEKWEDEEEFVRPMRSLWLGRGKMRRLGEQTSGTAGNINWMMQAMANSTLGLVVYVLDGHEE